jgi:hypothetical protein
VTNHFTPEEVAIDCIKLLNLSRHDICVDAGSGKDKVWYNNLDVDIKYECELEEGNDFLKFGTPVDWVVGNPPFNIGWDFLYHSSIIAKKGIGILGSYTNINSNFTPLRLDKLNMNGFSITKIHVLNISKWYGRYFFVVYEKNKPSIVSWNLKNYRGE